MRSKFIGMSIKGAGRTIFHQKGDRLKLISSMDGLFQGKHLAKWKKKRQRRCDQGGAIKENWPRRNDQGEATKKKPSWQCDRRRGVWTTCVRLV